MRIAEEANCRQITIKTKLSNCFNLYVSGKNFQVNFCEKNKWRVNVKAIWEHDPGSNTPIAYWLMMEDSVCITSVKNKYPADDKLWYCPDWSAPRKSSRPKMDKEEAWCDGCSCQEKEEVFMVRYLPQIQ